MNSKKILFITILLFLFLERLFIYFTLPPILEVDSDSYLSPALHFLEYKNFDETLVRLPAYPLFLAAVYSVKPDNKTVVILQHLLGLFMILLVMKLVPSLNGKLLAGALFIIDSQLLRYEHSILADFFFTFIITGIAYFFYKYIQSGKIFYILCLSISIAVGFLTKPILTLFPYIVLILLVFHFLKTKAKFKKIILTLFAFGVPVISFWLFWSLRNYQKHGYFGLSSSQGFQLCAVSEDFIDFSSPKHYPVKNVYKEHLSRKNWFRRPVVFKVIAELKNKYNYTDTELNKIFIEIAQESIRNHPFLYLKRVLRETGFFFLSNDSILIFYSSIKQDPIFKDLLNYRWKDVFAKFFLNSYIFYWLILLGFCFNFLMLFSQPKTDILIFNIFILLTIVYIAGISVFVDFGLPRYRSAVQPLMILWSSAGWEKIIKMTLLPKARRQECHPERSEGS